MKSKLILIPLSLYFFSLIGCSLMRGPGYSYNNEDEYASYAAQKNGLADTFDELGYSPSKKLTEEEELILTKRLKLKKMEKSLTEKERVQYYKFKPYMDTDDEKMEFLKIPSLEARQRFAIEKGYQFKTSKLTPEIKEAIERGDIMPGMTREAVNESWGDPAEIQVAGNRQLGNEKWIYTEYITTDEGYQKEERVVIFESGKVAGWRRYQ